MRYWMEATNYTSPMMGRDYFLSALDRTRGKVEMHTLMEMASHHKLHFFGPLDTPEDYEDDYPGITDACQIAREIGTYNDDMPRLHMYDETAHVVQSAIRIIDFIWDINGFVRYTALDRNILMEFTESKEDYIHARNIINELHPDPELKEFTNLVNDCISYMADVSHLNRKELDELMDKAKAKADILITKTNEKAAIVLAHSKAKVLCHTLEVEGPDKPFMGYEITPGEGIVFYRDGVAIKKNHNQLSEVLKA